MLKRFPKDEQAVSPVIATILMVAVTVVVAATVYMMMTPEEDPKGKKAMSGRLREVDYGWIIDIDGGSVKYETDKVQIYNPDTGAVLDNTTEYDGGGNPPEIDDEIHFIFRDNNDNGDIDGGDAIVIGDQDDYLEDRFEFRIQDTSLELEF